MMRQQIDYYISAVRTKGGHITHLRVHRALSDRAFAPHGIVQPRSTVVINIRNNRGYQTLQIAGREAKPGAPVELIEQENRFYLRISAPPVSADKGDDLGDLPSF